jgi:hypothetical protein
VSHPWVAGERYTYALSDAGGNVVGEGVLTTSADAGRLVLEQHYTEANPPARATPTTDAIRVIVDATTMRPLEGQRETLRRDADGQTSAQRETWRYTGAGDAVRLETHQEGSNAAVAGALAVRAHFYDNESSLWLWRAIGFVEGYERLYVSVNPFERSQQTVSLRVPRREPMTVPAGTFDTWRVILRSGRAVRTAWINTAAPYQVIRWDNGDLVFELTKIEAPRP